MFKSADNYTFGTRTREILATVALMWFSMLLAVSVLKVSGLASVNFSNNMPVLGVSVNYWLQSQSLTLGQALVSPFAIWQLLGIFVIAPFGEEVVFRGICSAVADEKGKLMPRFLFVIISWSFIAFGLAHGHWYFSVMVQGVGGLWLARLWFRNGPNMQASYFSCVAAHSLYNISCVTAVWLMAS